MEIIAVCSQIHIKHINTLCGQNVELDHVQPLCNEQALRCSRTVAQDTESENVQRCLEASCADHSRHLRWYEIYFGKKLSTFRKAVGPSPVQRSRSRCLQYILAGDVAGLPRGAMRRSVAHNW